MLFEFQATSLLLSRVNPSHFFLLATFDIKSGQTRIEKFNTFSLFNELKQEQKGNIYIKNISSVKLLPPRRSDYLVAEQMILDNTNLPRDLVKIIVDFIPFC
jgi:hypothetical protein